MSSSGSENTVTGTPSNFWLFNERHGFDITHPTSPEAPFVYPRMKLQTSRTQITLAPNKTALVIIDMQNYFLSVGMGRTKGAGHAAEEALLDKGIPAARKAGIRIIWLCWGLSDATLQTIPPMFIRNFGMTFDSQADTTKVSTTKENVQEWRYIDAGLGQSMGYVTLENGGSINAGRKLMQNQWNTELHGALANAYREGTHLQPADVKIDKERYSGFGGANPGLASYLKHEGITTLLFAGVNTDQCVLSTLHDAAQQGYDTIMLQDACGTTSPNFAQQMVEFNAERAFGFRSTCGDLQKAAETVERASA